MNQQSFHNARLLLQRVQQLQMFWGKNAIWDQFRYTNKMPQHPKIVVLQANKFVRNLLDRQFTKYARLEVSTAQSDDSIQRLAEQVQLQSTQTNGALLYGFPTNQSEAQKLDVLLDGVNLAISFKLSDNLASKLQQSYLSCKSCGKIFNTQLPFATLTHPGYENSCENPTNCNLESSSTPDESVNEEVKKYYEEKGSLLVYEIDEEHLFYDQKEFNEKLEAAVATHIKL